MCSEALASDFVPSVPWRHNPSLRPAPFDEDLLHAAPPTSAPSGQRPSPIVYRRYARDRNPPPENRISLWPFPSPIPSPAPSSPPTIHSASNVSALAPYWPRGPADLRASDARTARTGSRCLTSARGSE